MGRKLLFVLIFLPFLLTCRNNLLDLSNEKASLSIGVSINRSLYSGDFGGEAGRFLDLSTDSLSVAFTAGGKTYESSVTLEIDTSNPDRLTGTATISGLPAAIPGILTVQSFNVSGVLVCDGTDELTLEAGNNTVTITLRISEDSPLLETVNPDDYIYKLIPAGQSIFLRLGPLNAGTEYYLIGDTINDIVSQETLTLVSDFGEILPITTIPDMDELYFTPTVDGSYVFFSVYNGASQEMEAMAWWGTSSGHTALSETNRIDITTSSVSYLINDPMYFSITADNGRFYFGAQGDGSNNGFYTYTDNGTSWTAATMSTLIDPGILWAEIGIPDMVAYGDYVLRGQYYLGESYIDLGFDLGISDVNDVFNYVSANDPPEIYYTITTTPVNNYRIDYSGVYAVLASVDESSNLHIGMSETYPGYVGSFNPATIAFASETGTEDNLQIASVDQTCYLIADSGSVYTYSPGAGSLSGPVFSISVDTNTYRHLEIFKNQYVTASSPLEAAVFFPELNKALDIYDENNPPEEIQPYIDLGYTFDYHLFSSENYLVMVQVMEIPATGTAYYVMSSENGGFSWIISDITTLTATDTLLKVDLTIDETLNEIYVGTVIAPLAAGPYYELQTYKLQ